MSFLAFPMKSDPNARAEYIARSLNASLPTDYQEAIYKESLREFDARKSAGMDRKVLLLGGAGYIGTIVARHLLERGYAVKCLDNLIYGHYFSVLPFLTHPGYQFERVDMCDTDAVMSLSQDCTDVVILAGLVGDPITKKYPQESDAINTTAIDSIFDRLRSIPHLNKTVFISTCSNYGLIETDELATETHALNPLSLYAKAKVTMEQRLLGALDSVDYHPTVLRFATAFGYSPRMRFDLTVSEFTRDLYLGKELVVYDADTWRPYCHVEDFADLIRRVLEAPVDRVRGQVFNAGSDKNNFTKRKIVEAALDRIPDGNVKYQEKGSDPRNYRVDFSKVRSALHFEGAFELGDGIDELVSLLRQGFFTDADLAGNSYYGNYSLEHYRA